MKSIDDPLLSYHRISKELLQELKKKNISTALDLLLYFPSYYHTTSPEITEDRTGLTTWYGTVSSLAAKKSWKTKIASGQANFEDITGKKLKIIWFRQPYIAKMIPEGSLVKIVGKLSGTTISNPEYEILTSLPYGGRSLFDSKEYIDFIPKYKESKHITSLWVRTVVKKLFLADVHKQVVELLPENVRATLNLPDIATALMWIHFPKKESHIAAAKKRFAFQEIFLLHLHNEFRRAKLSTIQTYSLPKPNITPFLKQFSFSPTKSQSRALETIFSDIKKNTPMSRLLEGDVGSGKTFVAAAASYAVVTHSLSHARKNNILQVALMAPTEILATQHFESFIEYFKDLPISIGLLTGNECRKFPSKVNPHTWTTISKSQLKTWMRDGSLSIVIGTHALIQKTVEFRNLALAIIDEQHRFGIKQRQALAQKQLGVENDALLPHLLSMTATPIPRTLALTLFGDLDLSVLDDMPQGRKPVITSIATVYTRKSIYEEIRSLLKKGKQAYVICPRIEETQSGLQTKTVAQEVDILRKEVFPEFKVVGIHGKMKPAKKTAIMRDFSSGNINILVSTSVVEVGVNVPNATVMIIENAERFGLSQLHQLRGRIARSSDQAYCYLFCESSSEQTLQRLSHIVSARDGFELAEFDLQTRGAGELLGTKQSGMSDIAMEALKNIKLVELSKECAKKTIKEDASLSQYPYLKQFLEEKESIHEE